MSANSKIEWTDATWNPLRSERLDTGKIGWHCEKISPACDHCYAASMNKRSDGLIGIGTGFNYAPDSLPKVSIEIDEKMLLAPLKWKRPRKIFVCSMTDLFGDWHTDDMIDRVFAVMALCQQHTFQVLTKRPERMRAYLYNGIDRVSRAIDNLRRSSGDIRCTGPLPHMPAGYRWWSLPNVWLGVTAEDMDRWRERVEILLEVPAARRFVSVEPMLGPVKFVPDYVGVSLDIDDIRPGMTDKERERSVDAIRSVIYWPGIDWIIAGGESGPNARPSHPDWFRSLRDQCVEVGVPFFFKQWGAWAPGENVNRPSGTVAIAKWFDVQWSFSKENLSKTDGHIDDQPDLYRVGKKAAGRLLDGREWNEIPEARCA